jgi:hypothetical protein
MRLDPMVIVSIMDGGRPEFRDARYAAPPAQ